MMQANPSFSFSGRQPIFDQAIHQLANNPFANPQFFSREEIAALIKAAHTLPFRKATPVVGNNVHQDFEICFPAPIEDVFALLAKGLEDLAADFQSRFPGMFESPVQINDFAAQRYPKLSDGIGIHKDGIKYRNLIFIVTLSGASELYVCANRLGEGRVRIDDTPGRLVILPAPGFSYLLADDLRPLHGVDTVTDGRLSLGFRCQKQVNKKV